MIVIYDYQEGRVYAGHTKSDMMHLDSVKWDAIENKLHDDNSVHNPVHITSRGNDFYVFYIDYNELMTYMIERDCANFITGI